MASFIIPTIFTAINRFSGPANQVSVSMQSVASTAGRAQVAFSTFNPLLDKTTTGLLSFAKSAVLIGGILGGITFSAKSIIDYDKALAKFRIVVDDLNDADFSKFKFAIKDVADATQSSMVDVANTFEAIAQISPEFAKTPAMITSMANASILLGRAADMELKPAAESLTKIMNQNNLAADQAMRTANVLAASAAIGAASVADVTEAYKNFGSVGYAANMTIEQSNAALQVLAKGGVDAATAGTKLKRAILELQAAGVGFNNPTHTFNFMEALETVKSRMDNMTSDMQKKGYLRSLFGMEGVEAGSNLLNKISLLKEYEKALTGTNEVEKQAAITTGTMAFKLEALKNAFQNVIIESNLAKVFTFAFGAVVGFVSDHMGGLLTALTVVLVPMLAFKSALMTISVAARITALWTGALSYAQGFLAASSGVSALALRNNSAAMRGYTAAATIARNATLLLNVAIGAGILALVGFAAYASSSIHEEFLATKGVDALSESYNKLGRSVTDAEMRLASYKELKGRLKERADLEREASYAWKRGGVKGFVAGWLADTKLEAMWSDFSPGQIQSDIKNLGFERQFADPNYAKQWEDSTASDIEREKRNAVDSASGRRPVSDIRNSTNVAAPVVNVYTTVNRDGTMSTSTSILPAKDTSSTSKWAGQ